MALRPSLPKQPVDLLTEPHTALNNRRGFFPLAELRYSVLACRSFPTNSRKRIAGSRDFLHALSRGYQAASSIPMSLPIQPYMAPQNFSYSAHDGASGTLKDFRRQKTVLLVLFSWPESRTRLDQLRLAYATLRGGNTVVLAVPVNGLNPQDLAAITADMPFPVVTQGAPETVRSYALFRRTLSNPDLAGEGTTPKHMEFLMDRYGYLRARWIPAADGAGWTDIDELSGRSINSTGRRKSDRRQAPCA